MIRLNTYLRIGMFFGMLLLPMVVMILGVDPRVKLNEKRQLTPRPRMHINRKFAKSVDRYLEDHFGGRKILAKTALMYDYHIARYPVIKNVLFGEMGWLYYGTRQNLKKYAGVGSLSPAQLATMVQTINEQHRFCTDRGIRYLLVVAPDKNTIYPEYMPRWLRDNGSATPMKQLKDAISFQKQIEILDLSSDIIKEKPGNHLYWKTDTHWTQLGAFYGYRQIARHLSRWFPSIAPMTLADFHLKTAKRHGGDLAIMIGRKGNVREAFPMLIPKKGWNARRVNPGKYYLKRYPLRGKRDNRLLLMETGNSRLPKAIVFRDSFAEDLDSFLAEHFHRIVFHWHFLHEYPFDEALIDHEKPDVVILEVAERSLHYVLSKGNGPALHMEANSSHIKR